jgi:hypothetical protein
MRRTVLLALVALLAAAPARADRRVDAPPSAKEFARVFVGVTNAFALELNEPKRVSHADCVQAAIGRYMCSYAISLPGGTKECHLMQARWTPRLASTITVTLAGRTARCDSLREAIATLGA